MSVREIADDKKTAPLESLQRMIPIESTRTLLSALPLGSVSVTRVCKPLVEVCEHPRYRNRTNMNAFYPIDISDVNLFFWGIAFLLCPNFGRTSYRNQDL
jgi:hypothetical protein